MFWRFIFPRAERCPLGPCRTEPNLVCHIRDEELPESITAFVADGSDHQQREPISKIDTLRIDLIRCIPGGVKEGVVFVRKSMNRACWNLPRSE
jgi:hypothetical protein